MGKEIEHKFLIISDTWQQAAGEGIAYTQAYLSSGRATVRARVAGDKGFLTLKGKAVGITRSEYEYQIPVEDAREMIRNLAVTAVVEKTRYLCLVEGETWEIDVFHGENEGLLVAEIELKAEDEVFELPDWAGECVTSDYRYANSNLANFPYSQWDESEKI